MKDFDLIIKLAATAKAVDDKKQKLQLAQKIAQLVKSTVTELAFEIKKESNGRKSK